MTFNGIDRHKGKRRICQAAADSRNAELLRQRVHVDGAPFQLQFSSSSLFSTPTPSFPSRTRRKQRPKRSWKQHPQDARLSSSVHSLDPLNFPHVERCAQLKHRDYSSACSTPESASRNTPNPADSPLDIGPAALPALPITSESVDYAGSQHKIDETSLLLSKYNIKSHVHVADYHILLKLLHTLNGSVHPSLDNDTLFQILYDTVGSGQHLTLELVNDNAFAAELAEAILDKKESLRAVNFNAKDVPVMETTDQFLSHISNFVRQKNARELQSYLAVGPNFNEQYHKIIQELRQHAPNGSESVLDAKCAALLPEVRDGFDEHGPWGAFVNFIVQYLVYLRDLNVDQLLDTYNLLRSLVQKCNTALNHATLGVLMLPSLVTYSGSLAHFAMMLDKRPDLLATVRAQTSGDAEEERETLPEVAARTIREGFVNCLNDRAAGIKDGKPEGKKAGIYKLANICLKVYYRCNKNHNSNDIFRNVYKYSPPLKYYPKPDQVTYLYYLGRFMFDNQHFFRAAQALEEAYSLCSNRPEFIKQRRLILVQLVASNIILGKHPSKELYSRPEAQGFKEAFQPVCDAIKKGDIHTFHRLFDFDGPCFEFFWKHKMYYQLEGRCVVTLNRSLVRKVFLLKGDHGDAQSKKAPTLMVKHLSVAYKFLKKGNHLVSEDQRTDKTTGRPNYPPEVQEKLDIMDMESILTGLISQGLINGYLSHKQPVRLAISGAKTKGALAAGFPPPYEVYKAKAGNEVPGWKKEGVPATGIVPGGNVVNLSGVRPIGSAAFK